MKHLFSLPGRKVYTLKMKTQQKNKLIWKEVELRNFLEISSGKREKGGALKEGNVASLGGQHIGTNGKIIWSGMKFVDEEFFNNLKNGKVKINDILVVKDGATTGKVAFVDDLEYEKVAINEHVFILRVKEGIYSKYLFYFLYSQKGQTELRIGFHGMIGGIGSKDIQKIKIPLPFLNGKPDLPTQKKIVAILEKAEELKQKQKKQLELYDEYLKSVFWEMFLSHGDDPKGPNEKGKWEEKSLSDVCEITSSKRIYQNEYVSEGIPFYRSKEVIELSKNKEIGIELFISKEKYWELKQKFGVPKKGDILITAVGTIGKTYVIPNNNEFYFKDGNLLWIRNLINLNSIYLNYFLFNHFRKNKNDLSSGSAYSALTIIKLKTLKIPLPPLELQQKFAVIVEKVEKLKEKQKKSLEDSEELFNALMQKAFRGDLS